MEDEKKGAPQVGDTVEYFIDYGQVTIVAVNGKIPGTNDYSVDVMLKNRLYDSKTKRVYGTPPQAPPEGGGPH